MLAQPQCQLLRALFHRYAQHVRNPVINRKIPQFVLAKHSRINTQIGNASPEAVAQFGVFFLTNRQHAIRVGRHAAIRFTNDGNGLAVDPNRHAARLRMKDGDMILLGLYQAVARAQMHARSLDVQVSAAPQVRHRIGSVPPNVQPARLAQHGLRFMMALNEPRRDRIFGPQIHLA